MPDFGDISIPGGAETTSTEQSTTTQTPEIESQGGSAGVDLNDDTLVRGVPGYNEPVRYGDLAKRLQADYTRKTQEVQKQKTQYETEWQTRQRELQERQRHVESIAAQLASRQNNSGTPQNDPLLAELTSAQYIDGAKMGKFINMVQEKGFAPIVKAFADRDQIIQGMYNQVLELQKTVKDLQGVRQSADFDGKINRWLTEGGYPQEAAQLAKELYLAYEGDNLDDEFPQIFEQRWTQLQNVLRAQDRKRVDDAKRQGMRLPGRGGQGATGKPIGLKGHEKARDVAASLWDQIQTGEET